MKQLFLILVSLLFPIIFYGQTELTATESLALIEVNVTNMQSEARANDCIAFHAEHSDKVFKGTSDTQGKFSILLPEGHNYLIKIEGLVDDIDFDKLAIPEQEGSLSGHINIRYEPAKSYTLDDVHFETGKAVLKASSFAVLNELAEALMAKPELKIEIAGHTDNVGDDAFNQQLSEKRASAVVDFLVKKGIEANRLKAEGYGENQPIADNLSEAGRSQNRRTEARIIADID